MDAIFSKLVLHHSMHWMAAEKGTSKSLAIVLHGMIATCAAPDIQIRALDYTLLIFTGL